MARDSVYCTFDDEPVIHAGQLAEYCSEIQFPTNQFWAKANGWRYAVGCESGRGYVLVPASQCEFLDFSVVHYLRFINQTNGQTVTFEVWVVKAETVTPGQAGDRDAASMLHLADARYFARKAHSTRSFNVNHHDTPDVDYFSTDPVTLTHPWDEVFYQKSMRVTFDAFGLPVYNPHTWQEMLDDLWDDLPDNMGPPPVLPYTPHTIPRNYQLNCEPTLALICEILDKLELDLVPSRAGVFSYQQRGTLAQESAFDTLIQNNAGFLTFRADPKTGDSSIFPEKVVICFHPLIYLHGATETQQTHQDVQRMTATWERGFQTGKAGAIPGSNHVLWDEMPAIYDEKGVLLNAADLEARATIRYNLHLQALERYTKRVHNIYSGLVGGAFTPSGVVTAVDVHMYGNERFEQNSPMAGLVTEVIRRPEQIRDMWEDWGCCPARTVACWNQSPDQTRRHIAEERQASAYILQDMPAGGLGAALVLIGCHDRVKPFDPPPNECTPKTLQPEDPLEPAEWYKSIAQGVLGSKAVVREVYDEFHQAPRAGTRCRVRFDYQTNTWSIDKIDDPEFFVELMARGTGNQDMLYSWREVVFPPPDPITGLPQKPVPMELKTIDATTGLESSVFVGRSGELNAWSWGIQKHNSQGGAHPEVVRIRRAVPRDLDVEITPGGVKQYKNQGFVIDPVTGERLPTFNNPGDWWVFEYSVGPDELDIERMILAAGREWKRNGPNPVNNRTGCLPKGYVMGLVAVHPDDDEGNIPGEEDPPTIPGGGGGEPPPSPTIPGGGGGGEPPTIPGEFDPIPDVPDIGGGLV